LVAPRHGFDLVEGPDHDLSELGVDVGFVREVAFESWTQVGGPAILEEPPVFQSAADDVAG
jgi:hypothetical protein